MMQNHHIDSVRSDGMAFKKKRIEPTPIFLSSQALAKEYRLTKNDKRIVKVATSGLKRKPSAALMKPKTPDGILAAVIGSNGMPRTEVTKKIWAYIKRNGLQDKKNQRMINSDDKLRPVFGGKGQVSMFEMTKLVSRHLK
jgi:chromatin remodeling complex protein RSC6